MKKIYQSPETYSVNVAVTSIIAASLEGLNIVDGGSSVGKDDAWVKGDRGASRGSRSDYNVWNDDWSQ